MNDRVDEYFARLRGKHALVLGIGVSNRPLIRMLLGYGIAVTACDRTPREKLDPEVLELERMGARLHTGEDYLDGVTADIVFRTPGMRPDLPQIARMVEQGAVLTSEMEVFFEVCPCRIIAVTGSDGKTTTTTLISELLRRAGHRVWVGGNIGTPLLPRAAEMRPEDFAVVELSSFQLMTMTRSADVAVVTNLAPNHLDVHKSMEEYIAAKKNVFLHQNAGGKLVLNMDNAITDAFAAEAKGAVEKFSRLGMPENGVYLKDGVIFRNGKKIMDDYWTGEQPRACIGQSEKYEILMLVIEGRYPLEGILGTSVNNCSEILLQHKCMQAINLDGGSSAMLWFDGEYVTQSSSSPLRYTGGRPLPNAWVYKKAQ